MSVVGSTSADIQCAGCQTGQFRAGSSQTAQTCQQWGSCQAGQRVSVVGSTSADIQCVGCQTGQFRSGSSQTEQICIACDAGRYGAGDSTNSQCSGGCDVGKYSSAGIPAGPTGGDCIRCDAGRYGAGGSTNNQCSGDCDAGKYSLGNTAAGPAGGDCIACDAGRWQSAAGNDEETDCIRCDAGRYGAGGSIVSQCSGDCDAGKYSLDSTAAGPAGSDCIACDAGRWQSAAGNDQETDCIDCIAGKYVAAAASDQETDCIDCVAGKYSDVTGSDQASDCINCVVGKYVDVAGSDALSDCIDCVAGKYIDVTGSDTAVDCIDCVVGKYIDAAGSDALSDCIDCVVGKYIDVTGNDDESDCIMCSAGKYIATTGGDEESDCILCPENTARLMPGADAPVDCIACPVGYAAADTGSSMCEYDLTDDCVGDPCGAGGTCTDVGLGFACGCDDGYALDAAGLNHDVVVTGACDHLAAFRGLWDANGELNGAATWTRPKTAGDKYLNFRFEVTATMAASIEITVLFDHSHSPIDVYLVSETMTGCGQNGCTSKVMVFKIADHGSARDLRSFEWATDVATSGVVWDVSGTRDETHLSVASFTTDGQCTLESDGTCVGRMGSYTDNELCDIKVSAATTVIAVAFDTESGYDYLRINDGQVLHEFAGSSLSDGPQSVAVTPESIISWSSDGSVTKSGWLLCAMPAETENWIVMSVAPQWYSDGATSGRATTDGAGVNHIYHIPNFYLPRREPALSESRWLIDSDTDAIIYPADASEPTEYAFDAFVVDDSATAELLPSLGSGGWVSQCSAASIWYPDSYSFGHVGRTCTVNTQDDCADDPCGVGGTCTDTGLLYYACSCAAGYALNTGGTTCEPDLTDDCTNANCGVGGTCVDIGLFDFTCSCGAGSLDASGQAGCFTDCCDGCQVGPGGVGGSCATTINPGRNIGDPDVTVLMVTCGPGYVGGGVFSTCAPDFMDDCGVDTCGQGGHCTDEGVLARSCTCDDGYLLTNGGVCEVDLTGKYPATPHTPPPPPPQLDL